VIRRGITGVGGLVAGLHGAVEPIRSAGPRQVGDAAPAVSARVCRVAVLVAVTPERIGADRVHRGDHAVVEGLVAPVGGAVVEVVTIHRGAVRAAAGVGGGV